jgi:SOS-response transcriptional repressor LexA
MQEKNKNNADISEIIRKLVENTGNNINSFAKKLGYERSQAIYDIINGKAKPSLDFLDRLKRSEYSDISIDELFWGDIKQTNLSEDPSATYAKKIPLVNTEAIAGFGNMNFNIAEENIAAKYTVPDFTNIDFMIKIRGSSMYPKYNAGDIVACRIIRQSSFIQWNKTYIIATTEQGILCKRLKKGSTAEKYLAISDNKEYDPFEIPISEITGIALVIGVIRLE